MTMKKLTHIAVLAFAVAMILAVSSLAYSVDFYGHVLGLEDGVEYTYAQYDFTKDSYGEFAELTDTTVLTSGIWGIKAGDAQPEVLFVCGEDSGKTSFWTDGATAADNVFDNSTKDTYLPGKWTISSNGAFSNIRCYKNAALTDVTVCIDVAKAKVIEKKTVTTDTQKTVTIEGVAYPVYAIDGAEYYLVSETTGEGDEAVTTNKYYAVADNSEYTGENAESATVVYTTEITWTGIEGEANKSQESVYYYGFTNDQVIPASELEGYTIRGLNIFTGGLPVASNHTKDEAAPKLTYFTKKIGSDEVTEYSVKNTAYAGNGKTTFAVPADMPADAYIVGFAIAPYDGLPDDYFTNLYKDGAWNTESYGYFHQTMYTNSSNGVTVALPEVIIPAPQFTIADGKVTGLDWNKRYEYASLTIDKNGTAITYTEAQALTADTAVGGLVVVREVSPNGNLATEWSDPIYVAGGSIGNIIHTTTGTTKDGVTKEFIDLTSGGSWGLAATPVYNERLWTGFSLSSSLAKNYGYDPLILGTTSGQGTFSYLNTTDATALAAAQLKAQAHLESIYYSYKYSADEIIPMEMFESFKFRVAPRGSQGLLDATAGAKTKFTFKVITEDGELEDRVVYKAAGNLATTTHVVTLDDFADTTGYIVAILINPYVVDDATTIKYKNSAMIDFNIYHFADGYSTQLPKAAKPTGLYVENNVIKGLDSDTKYCYAYKYIEGKSIDYVVPAGATEIKGVSGIVGVMVASDGATYNNSDPVYFYVYGDVTERATLGVIDGAKAAFATSAEWKAGVWTGPYMSWYDWHQISETQTFLDQSAGINAEQAQNLWLYQVTKEEAQTKLNADAAKSAENGVPSSWTTNKVTSNPARLQAVIDAHYTEDYEDTKDAKKAALQQAIADGMTKRYMEYAYDETEIIPVSELKTMSFLSNRRQGSLKLTGVKSKVVFYVMQLDGSITEHEWLSDEFAVSGNSANVKVTVDVQSIEGLPTEGYIVGVRFYPWSTVNASEITYVMSASARIDASNVAFSFDQQQVTMAYYNRAFVGYDIYFPAEAPVLSYAPAEKGGYEVTIVNSMSDLTYKYKNASDTEWITVPAGLNKFIVSAAGDYIVEVSGEKVLGTAEAEISVIPVAPTAPELFVAPVLDAYKVKIENYFGAYTYEYKKADSISWKKVPAGAKYFTVEQDGDYVVRASGITYNGYAETTFTAVSAPEAIDAITFDTDTISGLDAELTYEYAKIDMYGTDKYTAIPAGTSFKFTGVGLWAVRLAATETEEASVARVFLVLGDLSARKTIINTVTKTYPSGTWYDKTITSLETIKSQAYSDRLNPTFVEGIWTGYKVGDLAYWNKDWNYSLGVVSGCVSKASLGDKITSGAMTQQEAKDFIASYGFRYKYEPAEIIAFNDIESFTFTAGGRQGHIKADGVAYTKVIAHVVTDYGFVETRELLLQTDFTYAGALTTHTISAADFDDQSGYIVALEVIPYGYIPETTKLLVDGATDSDWFVTLKDYQITLPRVEKPVVAYNEATGLVEGLDAALTYKYAKYTVNGKGTETTVTGVTTLELGAGLWGIVNVSASVENSDSLSAFVHIGATKETKSDIGTLKQYSTYTAYDYQGGDVWVQGKWSGKDISNHSSFGMYTLGTTGGHVTAASSKAFATATTDAALKAALDNIIAQGNNVKFRYSYNDDEILHVNDLKSMSFTIARRMGSLNLGYVTAKVTFVVACEDGTIRNYVWESERYNSHASKTHEVNPRFIANWPTEGYILAFQVNPWCDIDGSTVKHTYADKNTNYNTMANLTFIPDKYNLYTGDEKTETPVISFAALNQTITVTNYNEDLKYVYSCDNGVTWTAFEGNKFTATKASTDYIVKSLESLPYVESEASNVVTTSPVALVGTSLVLDGQIGIKVYIDVDTEKVSKIQHYMTKVNDDFYEQRNELAYGQGYRMGGGVEIGVTDAPWATKIQLDNESGLYYFIIYVSAKDLDNTKFETDLGYWPVGSTGAQSERVQVSSVGINFANYISSAKALAAAGDAEFKKALPLVEALETYTAYADNYFNNGTDAAYASTASTAGIEAATRTNADLEGVEFYGTSLLLEDQVTIRHYFTVSDMDAFKAAYNVAGMYGIKGDYIYFDIVDIPAQAIGNTKTLTIKDTEGNVVYEVKYSVANYIVSMMNDTDANLVSLVNAMYDYYLAAVDYTK